MMRLFPPCEVCEEEEEDELHDVNVQILELNEILIFNTDTE